MFIQILHIYIYIYLLRILAWVVLSSDSNLSSLWDPQAQEDPNEPEHTIMLSGSEPLGYIEDCFSILN